MQTKVRPEWSVICLATGRVTPSNQPETFVVRPGLDPEPIYPRELNRVLTEAEREKVQTSCIALVNGPGGFGQLVEETRCMFRDASGAGCPTWGFATNKACSAQGLLLGDTDYRVVLERTRFLLHMSHIDRKPVGDRKFFRKKTTDWFLDQANTAHHDRIIELLESVFADEENPLDDIVLKGKEMERYGLAWSAVKRPQNMVGIFERRSGWHRRTWPKSVRHFFKRQ